MEKRKGGTEPHRQTQSSKAIKTEHTGHRNKEHNTHSRLSVTQSIREGRQKNQVTGSPKPETERHAGADIL